MSNDKPDTKRTDIVTKLSECLKNQGYKLTSDVKIQGKSGIEHVFDIIGRLDDGLINSVVAVCIGDKQGKESEANTIFNFANKAYDVGIQERILIAPFDFLAESKQLAQKWRIKVFEAKQLDSIFNQKRQPTKIDDPLKFINKQQLSKVLSDRGYRVEENAKVQGRSGVEYTFDILAYTGAEFFTHSLGVDFFYSDTNIPLDRISLFDTKAYDTGIDSKVVVADPALSPEARQFAEQQRIRIFELGTRVEEPTTSAGEEAKKIIESLMVKPKSSLKLTPQPDALQLIPEVIARRYNVIPLTLNNNILEVGMANPSDIFAMEAIAAISRKRVKPVGADPKDVRASIDSNYKGYSEIEKQVSFISSPSKGDIDEKLEIDMASYTPLVQALNMIIDEAAKARSSDIHIEPEENRLRIRYRIDGTLHDMMSLPLNIHRAMISRVKILSELNIADSHHPQDGQFTFTTKDRQIDIRVATVPTVYGEMCVMRLLDKSLAIMELPQLGFLPDTLEKYQSMLKVPYGMVIIVGPTGSGKTTTLYASINNIDAQKNNIITIEDPAEYRIKDINQIQVNPQAGLTFASGLRSILRLDPNVIMVGEIRDGETVGIAVQAALTGHLMLTSMHANDTTSALSRIIDLGVEPFMAASSVIGVVSQRMVRRLCPDCQRMTDAIPLEQMVYERETGEKRVRFPYGTGCKNCSYTGYRGRVGVFEILILSDEMKILVANSAPASEMRTIAIKEGMHTMMHDGMMKVKMGITTPTEVLRAAYTTSL
ncbi:MAG: type II/IV secretion system protein [Dehalococcoidales bacterium]|nr:type II/IV secretion system protein [Dehalococcoidales bacterium]